MTNKLDGFPSVNMISLRESVDRRDRMIDQFYDLGIPYSFYETERWTRIGANHQVFSNMGVENLKHSIGTTISHLNSLRQWYLNTTEEYAIFADDDVSLESVKYWSFTWQEFLRHLPPHWEVVQLIRFMMYETLNETSMQFKLLPGNYWGSCFMMKRDYVRKLLNRRFLGWNTFDVRLDNTNLIECVENVLCTNTNAVYNFPLFLDMPEVDSTYRDLWDFSVKTEEEIQSPRIFSRQHFLTKWQQEGHKNIRDLMRLL